MSLLRRVRFALIHVAGAMAVLVGVVSIAFAQQPPAPAPAIEKVPLTAGRSTVLMTDFDITRVAVTDPAIADARSEEHTSELQSLRHLVCRLLLEKKKQIILSRHQ